jgi:hypothetical protein
MCAALGELVETSWAADLREDLGRDLPMKALTEGPVGCGLALQKAREVERLSFTSLPLLLQLGLENMLREADRRQITLAGDQDGISIAENGFGGIESAERFNHTLSGVRDASAKQLALLVPGEGDGAARSGSTMPKHTQLAPRGKARPELK